MPYRSLLSTASRTWVFSIQSLPSRSNLCPSPGEEKAAYYVCLHGGYLSVPLDTLIFLNLTPTRNRNLAIAVEDPPRPAL